MSLIIEPSDLLTFHRPLTSVTKETLLVRNPNSEPVIFKVKTTAPKQYCVRPNAGRIDGNSQVEVQVILQPFKVEPPLDIKCKDKFLVQSAQIQPHEYGSMPVTDIWSRIEKEDQGSIRQHKIKCAFVSPPMPENAAATESPIPPYDTVSDSNTPTHGVGSSQEIKTEHPPALDNIGSTSLLEDENTTIVNDQLTETTKEQPSIIDLTNDSDEDQQQQQPQTATPVTTVPVTTQTVREVPTPSSAVNDYPSTIAHETTPLTGVATADETEQTAMNERSGDDGENQKLRHELVASKQHIIRLEHELEQSKQDLDGLRLRQTAGAGSRKLPPTVQPLDAVHQHLAQLQKPHPVEGYPPKVVLIMCVAVFLFTYLFL